MTITVEVKELDKEVQKLSRRLQKELQERIRKLAPDVLSDLQALCKMLSDDANDDHRTEIAKAITEILWPDIPTANGPIDTEEDEREARKRIASYRRKVGETIRRRRHELGMTQEQLAQKAGLPQSHISRLEVGKHAATFTTMEKLATALDTLPIQLDPGFALDE